MIGSQLVGLIMRTLTTKPGEINLSVYGYGMMSLSVAIVMLLIYGFFNKSHEDVLFAWGLAAFAGASGALGLAMVRSYFPTLHSRTALLLATAFNLFLFGSYLTSYLGCSQFYALYVLHVPVSEDGMSPFYHFCVSLGIAWFSAAASAAACSVVYAIIQACCKNRRSSGPSTTQNSTAQ